MGFTGDAIIIKEDYSFDRIENINIGDTILGPEGPCIVTSITEEYKDKVFTLKTKNFLEFYIDKDTKILISKWFNLFNKDTNKFETYLKPIEYLKVEEISPTSLICINNLPLLEDNTFINPVLYGLLLNKASLIKNKDQFNVIAKNIMKYKDLIQKTDNSLLLQKENKNIYINNIKYPWIEDLDCGEHQRKINKELFRANKDQIKNFLITFAKSNTDIFIKEDEFRLYTESKILAIQLFYLFSYIYDALPIIEKVDKKTVEYKKIVQSKKKKHFALAMIPEIKTLKKTDLFYQEIDKILEIDKRLKIYNIEVLEEKPFYVNNLIIQN